MTAAAQLLSRRGFLLSHQRHKINAFSIPFLVTPLRSHNPLAASVTGSRKFTATASGKPQESPNTERTSSSGSRVLKFTTAGAAFLILSTTAWYAVRDDFPQVQHLGLAQLLHGHVQEKVTSEVEIKPDKKVAENFVQEDVVKETVEVTTGEQDQIDPTKPLEEIADNTFPTKVEGTGDLQSENSYQEPPVDSEQIPAMSENDSGPHGTQEKETPHLQTAEQKNYQPSGEVEQEQELILSLKEGDKEDEQEQEQILSSTEVEQKDEQEEEQMLSSKEVEQKYEQEEQMPSSNEFEQEQQVLSSKEAKHEDEPEQEQMLSSKEVQLEGEQGQEHILSSKEAKQEHEQEHEPILYSKEAQKEGEQEQEQIIYSQENEQNKQSPVEILIELEGSRYYEGDDTRDIGDNTREDIRLIREKLAEENPEMFHSDDTDDSQDAHHEDDAVFEKHPKLEMMESGSSEYAGRLSASYLVQKRHEDSVRRYLENGSKGEVSNVVDVGETIRKEEYLSEETKAAEEEPKVVGVEVLVGAIHTAEQLQAEIDGRAFKEQLHKLQEAHKRELKDFQAKIVAYAEDTDQLQKELKKEKQEAATALTLQEQRAEERLQNELKRQEMEATREKEMLLLLGKAQTAASVTREKADHLKDIHSMQLQVKALHTAFYTRSEEARISHTAHKLAMGAFALEDAIERGEPVEKEANLLIVSAGGPGVDPLVDAVVSSLPSEVLTAGTRTRSQLHDKFTRLKDSLRELALMQSGGGVFAHLFAKVTAKLKISEQGSDDIGSEGIEVVIGKVERLLAQENLEEAASVLERAAKGTAAEGLAVEWARQARNRAIIEQGLQVLRAHVIAVASGLS